MSEWKPIETAPKDGTWFNAYNRAELGHAVYPCCYDQDENLFYGMIDLYVAGGLLPTHWMPLPEPPND